MRPEDLLALLQTRPFVPFRIHTTDGRYYDIVHPEAMLVLRSRAIIGLRPDPATNIPDQSEEIALLHVVRTSEIPAEARQPTSGPAE
jgi:hypothetical protein